MGLEDVLAHANEVVVLDDMGALAREVARFAGADRSLVFRFSERGVPRFPASDLRAEMEQDYREEHFRDDPLHPWMRSLSSRFVVTTETLDRHALRASLAHRDFYARVEIDQLLGLWLDDRPYGRRGMTGFLLTRAGPDYFDERTVRALHTLRGPLRTAARRLKVMEGLAERGDLLEALVGSGCAARSIVWDGTGRIRFRGARADRLLGGATPSPLTSAARALLADQADDHALPNWIRVSRDVVASLVLLPRAVPGGPWVVATTYPAPPHIEGLSPAEANVLRRLARGETNPVIAMTLHVSVETVRTHVRRILRKLDVGNRTEAVVRAREIGLLERGDLAEE